MTDLKNPFSVSFNMLKMKYSEIDKSLSAVQMINEHDKLNVFINFEAVMKNLSGTMDIDKKILLDENAKFDGVSKKHWLTHNFCRLKGIEKINGFMFRYILPLNKQGKRILVGYPEYQGLKYPKVKDLKFWRRIDNKKYEEISAPKFDMEVLNYNRQR